MNYFYRIVFLLFFCFSVRTTFGQIPAPELYCISSDTIRWDPPIIGCGAFQSYDLYYSLSFNGPYILLAKITDATQVSYVFNNPPAGVKYYYMTTTAACPGLYSLSSDTLDSASPLPVQIQVVSVTGSDIDIFWSAGLSPETSAYVVYKGLGGGGVVALDTVTVLNYTDINKQTQDSVFTYYISALDRCGGTSIFSQPHATILLDGSIDTCTKEIILTFTPYVGWPGNISYDVLVSQNGGSESVVGFTTQNTFTLKNVPDETNVCIRIQAHEPAQNGLSYSNEICLQTKQSKTITDLCLATLDQSDLSGNEPNSSGLTTFEAKTNEDIPISNLFFQTGDTPSDLLNASQSGISQVNIQNSGSFQFNESDVTYLRLVSLDACGNYTYSNYITNLILDAHLKPNNEIDFKWNVLDWENATVLSYRLERFTSGTTTEVIASGDGSFLEYSDLLVEGTDVDTRYCYRVVATLQLNCLAGLMDGIAVSNIACVEKTAGVYMPNAFIPGGYTPEFLPVFIFKESLISYEMSIFDRYGGKVFTTSNTEKGWDGNKRDQPMPNGVYTYLVKLVSSNGAKDEKKGSVTLIR